jgi:hypothetical protein
VISKLLNSSGSGLASPGPLAANQIPETSRVLTRNGKTTHQKRPDFSASSASGSGNLSENSNPFAAST